MIHAITTLGSLQSPRWPIKIGDCSIIPLWPACGVYIFDLIWYARACSAYDIYALIKTCLMLQRFQQSRLKSAFSKSYGRNNDLVCKYTLPLGRMLPDVFYQLFGRSLHIDFDYRLLRFSLWRYRCFDMGVISL